MSTTFTMAEKGLDSFRTSERIADSMHRTVDRVAAKAGGVEHDLRMRIAALREEAREQEQRARDFAQQKPLAAIGIAFAVGVLLSGLFGRR